MTFRHIIGENKHACLRIGTGRRTGMEKKAYPITYGILGLLAFWGPLSGYDVKRLFDHTLSTMWGAAQSQIYKELRRMQEFGWVEMEREEQESRPDRKVYSITEQGRMALREWHGQPPEIFQLRDELLLKMLFGTFATHDDLLRNVRMSIDEHEMRLLAYRQNTYFLPSRGTVPQLNKRPNPYANENEEDPYFRLVARFAIEFERTYLHWLYEVLEEIEGSHERTLPQVDEEN